MSVMDERNVDGERRSRRAPDASHPLGYGRAGYVWAMFAAIG